MKNTFEAIDQEYLENAVLLLKQDGFFLNFLKKEKTIKIVISKDEITYTSRIKENASSAEIAEKILTTILFLSEHLHAKCEEEMLQCGGYLAFSEKHPKARVLRDSIDRTSKKLNVVRLTWYARRKAEQNKHKQKGGDYYG